MSWLSRGSAGAILTGVSRLLFVAAVIIPFLIPVQALAAERPEVAAQYAVVVDAGSGEVLYDKGMDTAAAPASLTKVFTAIAALDSHDLDRTISIDEYDLVGESSMGLQTGQDVSLRTLLNGLLLVSGNDAAMAIARNSGALAGDTPQQSITRFMDRVNSLSERLGLTGTHLSNPHGLDQAEHQSSARDLAAITMYALKNSDFRKIIGTASYHDEGFELYQANLLLGSYPGLIGGKTGYTDNAGYCLLEVAERDGHTIISVLLKSTKEAWYQDAATLLDYGFETVSAPADTPNATISLSPAPVTAPASVPVSANAGIKVERVNATTAIVRSTSNVTERGSGIPWRWPLAALTAMVMVLGLVLNGHTLIGFVSLVWQSRRDLTLPARQPDLPVMVPVSAAGDTRSPMVTANRQTLRYSTASYATKDRLDASRPSHASRTGVAGRPVAGFRSATPGAAESTACTAVKLARGGQYQEATNEFVRALRVDPGFDFARCRDFWQMGPAGLAAAVRAYRICDRPEDARTLLTILRLSVGSDRALERLFSRESALAG